jgi:glycopeptide antibiotics resistance protein
MGALRRGPCERRGGLGVPALAVGVSLLLGTAVELFQVLSSTRNSSWNDVMAQGLGSGIGVLAWLMAGGGVIRWLRRLANEHEPARFSTRLLQLYLPIYLLVQLTPFDAIRGSELSAEHQQGGIGLVSAGSFPSTLRVLRDLIGNALLNVPIGMLAVLGWTRSGTRRRMWRAALLGASVVLTVGLGQDFILGRQTDPSSILAGTIGVVIGIGAAVGLQRASMRYSTGRSRLVHPWLALAAGTWMLVLVGQSWYRFDFHVTPEIAKEQRIRMSFAPFGFYRSYAENPLQAVHEMLVKFLVAFPLGLLLRMSWRVASERTSWLQAVSMTAVAIIVLGGIEFGQVFVPMGSFDVTHMLIGTVGAIVGIATGKAFIGSQRTVRRGCADDDFCLPSA